MIRHLAIRNLAVIESASVEFERSFNVLTGETGAGKSMLVGAVGLLLGGRASAELVRTGEDTATVQAEFETADGQPLIVRREISTQGRSRAFIDDQLVTTAALRARLADLVELHGQHEHQALLDPATHVPLLDDFAGLQRERAAVAEAWEALQRSEAALARVELDAGERASRLDLVDFQVNELLAARLQRGEDEQLAATRDVLRHAGRLQTLSAEAYDLLYEHEHAALSTLGLVWKRLTDLAAIDPMFAAHAQAKDDVKAQLEDLALTLRDYQETLDASPARLQEVEDRLALLERLKRKHGPTLQDAIDKTAALQAERDALTGGPEQREAVARTVMEARARFLDLARQLSTARHKAAAALSARVERELSDLAMGQTTFDVRLTRDESRTAWHAGGIDSGEFYLAPNVGEESRPLARIASGGELSRIMLAMKTLNAGSQPGRTLVFDEVDAGIGGRTAGIVGEKLRKLGQSAQVLCITHLPQIAALAATHFVIDKTVRGPRTVTSVERLDESGREHEIARMMAGEASASDSVLAGAKALIAQAKAKGESRSKAKAKAAR